MTVHWLRCSSSPLACEVPKRKKPAHALACTGAKPLTELYSIRMRSRIKFDPDRRVIRKAIEKRQRIGDVVAPAARVFGYIRCLEPRVVVSVSISAGGVNRRRNVDLICNRRRN